jgi:GH24 family phage-related lysozyme (muramidase)
MSELGGVDRNLKRVGDVPPAPSGGLTKIGEVPVATPKLKKVGEVPAVTVEVKSKDVGYGHKVTSDEDTAGTIHGVKFKNEDGTYISLTADNKATILEADMEEKVGVARKKGWDAELKKLGVTWDDIDSGYQQALTSLAYNIGGSGAAKFKSVIKAANDKDVKAFAKELRRNDAGKKTAGMDNRVAKELFYSGLIKNFSEVSAELPLGSADVAGIPK